MDFQPHPSVAAPLTAPRFWRARSPARISALFTPFVLGCNEISPCYLQGVRVPLLRLRVVP